MSVASVKSGLLRSDATLLSIYVRVVPQVNGALLDVSQSARRLRGQRCAPVPRYRLVPSISALEFRSGAYVRPQEHKSQG